MTHSQAASELIKQFEGCRLEAYQDGNGIWTIADGHTGGVKAGDTCTQEQADAWLNEDLAIVDRALSKMVRVEVTQNQYDALVSFVYNIGAYHFLFSTCLKDLNAGDLEGAANGILLWNKVAGKVSAGLVRRRAAEKALFEEAV
jgi:lysozyme